ncbi:hypothetical protein [Pseudoalteromonas sp. G4]|uniref:hypothetical protein n=1 Tax=Pseudoalteromonas sp. G4 TaxID=2992761 RepID=UPI00237E111F|nr:hypothetical protein [Pseudoalteromonas sp. G4]MDE3272022.1 hypothetical protein [Pseudoalteromonas sp. G4]
MSNIKLVIRFRLEPGCLGPTGTDYVEDFCRLINLVEFSYPFVELNVIPRYDKTLPEWEFLLSDKLISESQADRVLELHNFTIESMEEAVDEFITLKVEQFMTSVKKNS